MSYINDALRKAQQEKDSRYGRYSGIISRLPGPRGHGRAKWIFVAVSVMMLTALFVWLTTADRQERPVAATQATPEKAAAAGQIRATAAPTAGTDPSAVQPSPAAADPVKPDTTGSGTKVPAGTSAAALERTEAAPRASTTLVKSALPEAKTAKGGSVTAPAAATGTSKSKPAVSVATSPAAKTGVPAMPRATKTLPDPGLLYREALAAQRNKKTAAAERLYRRILTLDAAHTGAMNNLGVIYMSQGKHDQALALFKRAIAERKDYVDPYYNLACLYARRQDAAGSIAYLKSAAAINRAVIDWAKTDKDLKPIREMDDFKKLLESGQ